MVFQERKVAYTEETHIVNYEQTSFTEWGLDLSLPRAIR